MTNPAERASFRASRRVKVSFARSCRMLEAKIEQAVVVRLELRLILV